MEITLAPRVPLPPRRISDARFGLRIGEQALFFVVGAALVSLPYLLVRIAGVLVLGITYARNLEFAHECIHGTAVSNKRLGRMIGTVLGLPMLVSFAQWRIEHAQHHREVRREGFCYEYERLTSIPELLLHLFMMRHFARACIQLFVALGKRRFRDVDRDYLKMSVMLAGLVGVSIMFRSPLVLWLWLLPLTAAAIVHTHIELPEHFGCERDMSDPFRNSRVIPANRFVTWFVNANNYHGLHHWDARVPNDQLPALYDAVHATQGLATPQNDSKHLAGNHHHAILQTCSPPRARETYGRFYRAFYRSMLTNFFARASEERSLGLRLSQD